MPSKLLLCAALIVGATSTGTVLKTQNANDIAGNPVHHDGYDIEKNVPHISFDAYQNAEHATKKFVRKMLVDGLREQFNGFKESFTQFADDEGFVREGISYCGAPSPEANNNKVPSDYKSDTGRLIENDGVGDSSSFNETDICSSLNEEGLMEDHCDENSIVGSLARLVRGLGLNIHHQDICDAVINSTLSKIPEPEVFTTTLVKYPSTRYERACLSKYGAPELNGRHFERNAKCFGTRASDCEDECTFFDRENTCFSVESKNKNTHVNGQLVDSDATCQNATKGISPLDWVNTVRRVTSYGLTQLSVESTDYAFVTGCKAGHCNSLRSILAALNGNAQINAFRDLGIDEAGEHWLNEIRTIKGYLVDFAYQLTNFRDLSLEIFPYIEDEEIEGCPMGETKFEPELTGHDEEPLCYQKNLDSEKLNTMDKTGQSFSRQKCLCRNGQLGRYADSDGNVVLEPNKYKKVEQDDIYLATDGSFDCDANTMPVSAYTYCKKIQTWGDMPAWSQTLESLLPAATKSRIKIYEYTNAHDLAVKRQTFVDNVAKTLPLGLETSCGRIVNADSETRDDFSKLKRSNRGGNCPPFPKMHEILYRLEYETGKRDMGEYKSGSNAAPGQFRDFFCEDSSFSSNAFSFRQLAYKWDGAAVRDEPTPKSDDEIGDWFNTHSLNNNTENPRYTKRFIVNGNGDVGTEPFCHPHWIYQIGGDVGRTDAYGQTFEDPYILLKEEIDEAVFNTKLAQAAKTPVREDNTLLWSYIESQLTENIPGTVVDHLGAAAGEHYMRIWVDEHS